MRPCGKVTGLLRHCISIALVSCAPAVAWIVRCADAAPPPGESKSTIMLVSTEGSDNAIGVGPAGADGGLIQQPDSSPELFPLERPPQSAEQQPAEPQPAEPQPMPELPVSRCG